MNADELIKALQSLSADDRKLKVTTYETGGLLMELERPRVRFRDADCIEARTGERVIVL